MLVKENGEYGIIDEKGNSKIKNKYDSIQSDGFYTDENEYKKSGYIVCVITNDGYRYGYYDCDGVQVLNEEYNQITRLNQIKNDIYLIAAQNGQYGVFINNAKIINTQYQSINYEKEFNLFIAERTGKYGAFNEKGTEVLKVEYDSLEVKGIYIYTTKGEDKKVFDKDGKEVKISFDTTIEKTDNDKVKITNGDLSIELDLKYTVSYNTKVEIEEYKNAVDSAKLSEDILSILTKFTNQASYKKLNDDIKTMTGTSIDELLSSYITGNETNND